ncbi:germ cell nuclear acidic protein isoform X2 [Drosophila bipectinata]|uniref:germ cell nuclear acidic protein isoform X2 n=1 Tax=Drosophila bipectinata TaxID=42026 RepID=UPI0038B2C08D
MADHQYKLFRAVDPSTAPKTEKQKPPGSMPAAKEHFGSCEPREQEDLDGSEYMDALQLSGDDNQEVEHLSSRISNLTMQPKEQATKQPEVSICISSTTEEGEDTDDNESCITISSDSSQDDQEHEKAAPDSMAVSDRLAELDADQEPIPAPVLTTSKVQRIEAFLRDVSFERREMERNGVKTPSPFPSTKREKSRLASADTESMPTDEDWLPAKTRPIDSSKRLADNETEVDTICSAADENRMDSSKRLADDETEANTLGSEDLRDSSKRLADNDTELNTICSDNSTLHDDEPIPDESIEIPETASESEASPQKPSASNSNNTSSAEEEGQPVSFQVSSINISAKINIKISIPTMESSSAEEEEEEKEEDLPPPRATKSIQSSEEIIAEKQLQERENQDHHKSMLSTGDASEDEQFLTHAEKLLNQLYGKSWQTPDVIRTLKRSSGSGGKTAPLKPRNLNPPAAPVTTAKKKRPPPPKPDESVLGDFSIFKRALRANETPLNSTRLPPVRAVQTERRPQRKAATRPRTNHIDEDRWRALVDSESGTDASDDEDADATVSGNSSDSSDGEEKAGDVTYLDLTKAEVEVISNPDEDEQSPKFHRRLDDILRSCRAGSKSKIPATPPPQPATTRRQLFTPNTGFEDDKEAREIVDRAVDLDMLEELEKEHLPGTPVHKRLQEVKKKLGIAQETPKSTPIFKLHTPQTAPPKPTAPPKSTVRKPKQQPKPAPPVTESRKCSFLKSLEGQVSRERADNEAYFYRENFAKNKDQLALHLYKMFNAQVFNNELDVPITWSKLLRNTAGRCMNKRKLNLRSSSIELSVKVLTTADRLRCTLIHELCHAAAWVFNGEGGHGRVWKMWARRAMDKFPDLPEIKVCHSYNIEFKYTYKCMSCNTSSHAHSRSRKVENLRCRLCRGPITLFLNKKDKQGNTISTPAGEAKGFAKFVKDNFNKFKRDELTAAEVMRLLSVEYAKQKDTKTTGETAASIAGRVEVLTLDD